MNDWVLLDELTNPPALRPKSQELLRAVSQPTSDCKWSPGHYHQAEIFEEGIKARRSFLGTQEQQFPSLVSRGSSTRDFGQEIRRDSKIDRCNFLRRPSPYWSYSRESTIKILFGNLFTLRQRRRSGDDDEDVIGPRT